MAAGIGTGKIDKATPGVWMVRIIEPCIVNAEPAEPGQVVECGCLDALYLIAIGRAAQWSPSKVRALR
jgi:hypothetical protein